MACPRPCVRPAARPEIEIVCGLLCGLICGLLGPALRPGSQLYSDCCSADFQATTDSRRPFFKFKSDLSQHSAPRSSAAEPGTFCKLLRLFRKSSATFDLPSRQLCACPVRHTFPFTHFTALLSTAELAYLLLRFCYGGYGRLGTCSLSACLCFQSSVAQCSESLSSCYLEQASAHPSRPRLRLPVRLPHPSPTTF